MARKKAAVRKDTPVRKAGAVVARIGKMLIIDGHEYEIVNLDAKHGTFEFARPDGQGEGETKFRRGIGVIADITEAEEGFLYLPNRITPKLEELIQEAVNADAITPEQAPAVTLAVRNHPLYPDRDDIAVRQVGEMYGIDLLADVAVRALITPED